VPPTETLTEGFCVEKPDPPTIVTKAAPEDAKPMEAFKITIDADCGRSYERRDEQEDHSDFTETKTLRVDFETTDEAIFATTHESATHKCAIAADEPAFSLAADNECW